MNPNQDPQIPDAGTVTVAVVPAAVAASVAVCFAWLWEEYWYVMISMLMEGYKQEKNIRTKGRTTIPVKYKLRT